jgi:hypothetical protein
MLTHTQTPQANLPFIMFETNTASCGGFAGVSQSFGAAMWILDYGMQMAYSNFSNALLHVGGQNVFYNPWICTYLFNFSYHPLFLLSFSRKMGGGQ